jgi:tetratricopeptide (TPR) repeat protein
MASGQLESYSREAIRKILRLSERQLSAWQKQGLLAEGPYSFSDLIAIKAIQKLRQNKIPLKKIQGTLAALKRKLVQVERPLTELKISSDGRRVIVNYQGAEMEPDTGQLLFNFDTRRLEASVRAFNLAAAPADSAARKRQAETWFLKGLELEEGPDTAEQAIEAYRRAIELNPEAAGAYINLGTIYYNLRRLDDAEKCYRAALAIDRQYALAMFNLGNVCDEQGKLPEARRYYEGALQLSPGYADAHYNLALVYEKLGLRSRAIHHWRAYLKLDPSSPWASHARQQLSDQALRLVPPENPPGKPR